MKIRIFSQNFLNELQTMVLFKHKCGFRRLILFTSRIKPVDRSNFHQKFQIHRFLPKFFWNNLFSSIFKFLEIQWIRHPFFLIILKKSKKKPLFIREYCDHLLRERGDGADKNNKSCAVQYFVSIGKRE